MPPGVRIKRLCYRCAYLLLRVYWLLRRPAVSGVKCVLTDGSRFLLVRHTYGPRSWDFPGGTIKRGEPPHVAIRREMDEELGIDSGDWRLLGDVTGRMHGRLDTLHCYGLELDGRELTVDPVELDAVRWFVAEALPPRVGDYVPRILALSGRA